jgi:hypothetical protein
MSTFAPSRCTTKSNLALAGMALEIAQRSLAPYSCLKSRHDFTQAQLFTMVILRQFLRLDYRRMSQTLAEWSDLRAALGLQKVPHFTTLQKAEQRLLKKGSLNNSSRPFSLGPAGKAGSPMPPPRLTPPVWNPATSVLTS